MPSEEERAELVSPIVKAVAQLNEWRGATDTHLSFGGKDIDIEKRIREFKNVDEVVESGILSFIPPLAEKAQEIELLASGVLPLSTHARGQLCLYIVPDEALRARSQEADALELAAESTSRPGATQDRSPGRPGWGQACICRQIPFTDQTLLSAPGRFKGCSVVSHRGVPKLAEVMTGHSRLTNTKGSNRCVPGYFKTIVKSRSLATRRPGRPDGSTLKANGVQSGSARTVPPRSSPGRRKDN